MFKKILWIAFFASVLTANEASAQRKSTSADYSNAVGLRIDFGTGTYFGFAGKHFFNPQGAGEVHLLFASGATMLGAEYQHHFDIPSVDGLKWYVGAGMGFIFYKSYFGYGGGTGVAIRPVGGIEYQVSGAPINIGFDWRPMILVSGGSGFEGGRFGLAARYTF
jgi:hypothetical protein